MHRSAEQLREDALRIWHAGLDAVRPQRLLPEVVRVAGRTLWIGDEEIGLDDVGRIVVVGAGKAGGSMAVALEKVLGTQLLREKQVTGWVNVPADCVVPTQAIRLHAARPAGINEPTTAGVAGTQEIFRLLEMLGPNDLCLCLISGGGSALLTAPVEGFLLAEKVKLTRQFSAAGANIEQLNTVRRELSRVKGGGLARACRAGRLVTLVLSDVPGDDLATIASGPTVPRRPAPQAALDVLQQLPLDRTTALESAKTVLQKSLTKIDSNQSTSLPKITNLIIGNNALAVDAAGIEAERLGYSHAMISATAAEGPVEEVAGRLVEMTRTMRTGNGPDCLITGGEPTVRLVPESQRGLGGRNQQLALAALVEQEDWSEAVLLSGGTDGEDGPTDAAGALVDRHVTQAAKDQQLDAKDFLRRNDAYHFFEQTGGLLKTGPTQTNVCDLRVVVMSN